jgi:hypothetical protein
MACSRVFHGVTVYVTSRRRGVAEPAERGTRRDPQRCGSVRRVDNVASRSDAGDTHSDIRGDVRGQI